MKKLNAKGFTLIELLAVVTIMGILMLVAIPAVSRTIENTRRDTFMDTARQYANSVETLWMSDGLVCTKYYKDAGVVKKVEEYPSQALANQKYYVRIDSSQVGKSQTITIYGETHTYYVPTLLEKGGVSSWKGDVKGYVLVATKEADAGAGRKRIVPEFSVIMSDNTHGIKTEVVADELKRKNVETSGATYVSLPSALNVYYCDEA